MRKDTLVALVILLVLIPLLVSLFLDRAVSLEDHPGARFFCAGYYGSGYHYTPTGGWVYANGGTTRRVGRSFRGRGFGGGK